MIDGRLQTRIYATRDELNRQLSQIYLMIYRTVFSYCILVTISRMFTPHGPYRHNVSTDTPVRKKDWKSIYYHDHELVKRFDASVFQLTNECFVILDLETNVLSYDVWLKLVCPYSDFDILKMHDRWCLHIRIHILCRHY